MEIDDVYEWVLRFLLAVAFVMAALVVVMLLFAAVKEVTHQISRLRLRRRERANSATATATTTTARTRWTAPPSRSLVEKLLQTIPDVPYLTLAGCGGNGGGDDDGGEDRVVVEEEKCVICVTPFEAGEACSVLPACKHSFHRACVAKWLRVRCTCPLCRAAVALPPPLPHPPPSLQGGDLNAAENMV